MTVAAPVGLLPEFDNLLRPDLIADPYAVYDRWRPIDPVHWNAHLDAWLLLRYDDVLSLLSDHDLLSSDRTEAFTAHLTDAERERFRAFISVRKRMLLYNDPPRHTELRKPVQRGMSVRLVNGMRAKIQDIADGLVDDVIEQGEMDGIQDIGYRLPVIVNSELIGVPVADRDKVKDWTADFIAAINAGGANVGTSDLERGQNAVLAMGEYFPALARRKRENPADDLLSSLVQRRERPLSDEDLVATCIVLMFAGLETALNLVGNGLLALLRHEDQMRQLQADPSLTPAAVEEILRYDGPLHLVGRRATRTFELHGRTIRAEDKVLVMLGAANRDPDMFADPGRLDIHRRPNQHVSFSHGVHYCPGAELSRILGQTAFDTILRRLPDLRLGDGELEYQPNLSFRGLRTLPLSFSPGRRLADR
ncbi:cytochrome P450 [Symbioplanes lichenis]|uniref:cytochrome P450 n=1 Tax=Symbioplanes lichenis TaxID=1629072 RepID=UPI002739FE08|nr:cytochrome P450 [Actinoplanes lichenis]